MELIIDVGNTQLFGGLFHEEKLVLKFRKASNKTASSDELGLFLRGILRENSYDPSLVKRIGCSSVVPSVNHSLASACVKYFSIHPFFLTGESVLPITLATEAPRSVGADRIANAVAAVSRYPGKNIFLVDFGTATTYEAITADGTYLGGAIAPGMRTSVRALEGATAQLPIVEIRKPQRACEANTVGCIQSGIFYGQRGTVLQMRDCFIKECFGGSTPLSIGTGGFSRLFEGDDLFDVLVPELVLEGVSAVLKSQEKGGVNRR